MSDMMEVANEQAAIDERHRQAKLQWDNVETIQMTGPTIGVSSLSGVPVSSRVNRTSDARATPRSLITSQRVAPLTQDELEDYFELIELPTRPETNATGSAYAASIPNAGRSKWSSQLFCCVECFKAPKIPPPNTVVHRPTQKPDGYLIQKCHQLWNWIRCGKQDSLQRNLLPMYDRFLSVAQINFSDDEPMHFRMLTTIYNALTDPLDVILEWPNQTECERLSDELYDMSDAPLSLESDLARKRSQVSHSNDSSRVSIVIEQSNVLNDQHLKAEAYSASTTTMMTKKTIDGDSAFNERLVDDASTLGKTNPRIERSAAKRSQDGGAFEQAMVSLVANANQVGRPSGCSTSKENEQHDDDVQKSDESFSAIVELKVPSDLKSQVTCDAHMLTTILGKKAAEKTAPNEPVGRVAVAIVAEPSKDIRHVKHRTNDVQENEQDKEQNKDVVFELSKSDGSNVECENDPSYRTNDDEVDGNKNDEAVTTSSPLQTTKKRELHKSERANERSKAKRCTHKAGVDIELEMAPDSKHTPNDAGPEVKMLAGLETNAAISEEQVGEILRNEYTQWPETQAKQCSACVQYGNDDDDDMSEVVDLNTNASATTATISERGWMISHSLLESTEGMDSTQADIELQTLNSPTNNLALNRSDLVNDVKKVLPMERLTVATTSRSRSVPNTSFYSLGNSVRHMNSFRSSDNRASMFLQQVSSRQSRAVSMQSVASLGPVGRLPRFGSHWQRIGFQGLDPATDLRCVGILALFQLCFLVTDFRCRSLARKTFKLSLHSVQQFPFCALGINFTLICVQLLRSGRFNVYCNRQNQLYEPINLLYASIWNRFFRVWVDRKCTVIDTAPILQGLLCSCSL